MANKFLIDTNILIYFLANAFKGKIKTYVQKVINVSFNISLITKIELLSYPKLTKNDENMLRDFLSLAHVLPVNDEIIEAIIQIKKVYQVKIPDAILAATAIENNFTLLTRNEKDFTKIKKLKLINPFNI
ncbi:MAG: type II toxin-antitoxin system VapC family toxin [bacterium]